MSDQYQFDGGPTGGPGSGATAGGSSKKVLVVVGVVLLLGLLCCGGGAALMTFAFDELGTQVQSALADDPVIAEHVGDIRDVTFSWGETIGAAEREAVDGDGMAFDVSGSRGEAVVLCVQGPDGAVEPVLLVLPDGSEIPFD